MDHSLPDDLILKSEFRNGITLKWGDFEFL